VKLNIKLIQVTRGEWRVELWIGHQGFSLEYRGNKKECEWYKRMLTKALNNLTN
jgi:hypothetical protein